MSLGTMSLRTIVPRYNVPRNNVPHDNCSSRQLFNGIIFLATIIPPFLYKWSFAKRTVVRMTKIKGDGGSQIVANDHPDDPASSVPLEMVICKEDYPSDYQN